MSKVTVQFNLEINGFAEFCQTTGNILLIRTFFYMFFRQHPPKHKHWKKNNSFIQQIDSPSGYLMNYLGAIFEVAWPL